MSPKAEIYASRLGLELGGCGLGPHNWGGTKKEIFSYVSSGPLPKVYLKSNLMVLSIPRKMHVIGK